MQVPFLKTYKIPVLFTLLSVACYLTFAYDLSRTEDVRLVTLYAVLFLIFYKLVRLLQWNFKFMLGVALLFRLLFLVASPNLSQDFYRFIWDGRMILEGFNPYLYTPESFINIGEFPVAQAQELFNGMGPLSASHFTNYPPVNQMVFFIAALLSGKSILGSVVAFRLIIIAADIGTIILGKKILDQFNRPAYHMMWYALNPFIIIELTGNLHFEGLMIFFLLLSLYLISLHHWKRAAVAFALSISVKLIPLLFLPLFITYGATFRKSSAVQKSIPKWRLLTNHFKKLLGFYAIVGILTFFLFVSFYSSEFIKNYAATVGLWFRSFEFNASLYYMARSIGYYTTGYNQIGVIGKLIPPVTVLVVLVLTFLRKNCFLQDLIVNMLLALSIYYFISTTVHPWYLATLLILSIFTNYKFPLVWSFMVVLSYLAYNNASTTENLWMIGLEYLVVYGVFFYEILTDKHAPKECLSSN